MWEKYDKNWAYFKSGSGQDGAESGNIITEGNNVTEDKEGLIWERENESKGSMSGGIKVNNATRFKQSQWFKNYGSVPSVSDWVNPEHYNLLFGESEHFDVFCWLACRYVQLGNSSCSFGLQQIGHVKR